MACCSLRLAGLVLPDGVDPRAGAALVDFCLAVCNLDELVYIDQTHYFQRKRASEP